MLKTTSTIANQLLAMGLDVKYWKRYMITKMRATLDTTESIPVCRSCGQQSDENNICCAVHVCGRGFYHKDIAAKRHLGICRKNEHCLSCCTCVKCESCNNIFDSDRRDGAFNSKWCGLCNRCKQCCRCFECENCGESCNRRCVCGARHHSNCCDCDKNIIASGANIKFITRQVTFREGKTFKENRSRRFLSIESESVGCEGPTSTQAMINLNLLCRKYKHSVVREGTCPDGWEINVSPASGDAFTEGVVDLYKALTQLNAKGGVRCGMHVHVDARDVHYANLANIIALYVKIEPALYAMLPPWRRINRFCVPSAEFYKNSVLKSKEEFVKTIKNVDKGPKHRYYGQQYDQAGNAIKTEYDKAQKYRSSILLNLMTNMYGVQTTRQARTNHKSGSNQHLRYMSLNLHSWMYQKTIEFRHWPAPTHFDLEAMLNWPQVCAAIIDRALRWSIKEIDALPDDASLALFEVLQATSYISPHLQQWAMSLIKKWTPDWAVLSKTPNACPFESDWRKGDYHYKLCFDMQNMWYFYLRHDQVGWNTQWGPFYARPFIGCYARDSQRITKGNKDFKYIAPNDAPVFNPAQVTEITTNEPPPDDEEDFFDPPPSDDDAIDD